MNLLTFLDNYQKPNFFYQNHVFCFYGCIEYPILFFAVFLEKIKNISGSLYIESLDLNAHDLAGIMARLQMSFLGSRVVYWLRDCGQLDEKSKKKLLAFIKNYNGPNSIVFYSTELLKSESILGIELPEKVDKKMFIQLLERINKGVSAKKSPLVNALFIERETISLDRSYALMRYVTLLGNRYDSFFETWLHALMVPEKSLFILSQYFFSKDAPKFFTLWSQLVDDYGDAFWIAFWSEQLWRTYNFVQLMHEKRFGEAKAIAFRLPFSVIQRDWKKLSLDELQKAHHILYQIDYSLKNGGSAQTLELLYTHFMSGAFNS